MREKDYSEYALTEAQRYRLRRQGSRDVLLDYFSNSVSFDPERRTFRIQVDDGKEDDWMIHNISSCRSVVGGVLCL